MRVFDREPINDYEAAPESTQVACPVCEYVCLDPPLYRYTVDQAAAHFCPPARDADRNLRLRQCIARLWERSECVVLSCRQCGFAFGHPFVGGDETFYQILHESMGYPNWRWDYDIAMTEAIQKFPGGRVLDIGAGVGKFLRGLADNWERYAVEGSESTRRELEAASVKVFRELSEAVQSNAGTFQVITLFQVLEHIADFDLILKQCHRLLVPGGRLVVTVPDGDAMIRQERMTGSPDMPPNHINKWTPGSLSRVLERTGFRLGQPMYEPPSWKSLRNNLHLRVSADAMVKNSLSSKAYGIRAKGLRIAILSFLGAPALIRMIRYGDQVWAGGAFGLIGTA